MTAARYPFGNYVPTEALELPRRGKYVVPIASIELAQDEGRWFYAVRFHLMGRCGSGEPLGSRSAPTRDEAIELASARLRHFLRNNGDHAEARMILGWLDGLSCDQRSLFEAAA